MKRQGGRRIVRLVRILTAIALIGGATTVAVIGWTLAQFRGERAAATGEQTRLRRESDELRRLTFNAEKETTFDEQLQAAAPPGAVSNLAAYVHGLLASRPDPAVLVPLFRTEAQLSRLNALAGRGAAWQAHYRAVYQDVSQDRTIGKVRKLIASLRGSVEEYEGRLRLDQAIRYNRWRKSNSNSPGNAPAVAAALLEQTGRQRQEFNGFGNDLSELARLAEVLNGEVQLDRFADLKDNQLKPIFESLNRAVDTFGSTSSTSTPLMARAVKEIEAAVFGDGYLADDAYQSIQPGRGGLFSLRQDVLQLQLDLAGLKNEQADIIRDIDADNAMFAQSAEGRTTALAQQVENRLTAGWWQARIFSAGSAALFLWLAWLITRGIRGQVAAIEERTLELTRQIAQRELAELDLERTNRQLHDMSRQAGMAEVATGVLHNVGNVLNSVNVSSSLIAGTVRKLRVAGLGKIAAMLVEHENDLGTFLTADSRGKLLPGFLTQLAGHLAAEQETVLKEVDHLQKNVEHIKEIVSTQQEYASSKGFVERLDPGALLEAALRMNAASLSADDVAVVREIDAVPPVPLDKHKVLQILVNLITNARQAMKEAPEKVLTVALHATSEAVRVRVRDTGCGIAAENLTRVFAHGFTTRKDGHGFGLHSSALAAREMNGSLTLHSDGPGKGAIFTLELPLAASQQRAA